MALVTAIELWAEGQQAMSELGRSLDDEEAETITPACPAWTVRQVFAHQAGVTADILAGRLDGVATDEWTRRQVDERADHALSDILDEWDGGAERLVDALSPLGDAIDPRLMVDLWNHDQDVRGAIGRPHDPTAAGEWVIDAVATNLAERVDEAGLAPLALDLGAGFGAATGPTSLRVPAFEYARAAVGRRSRAQIRSWAWEGEDVEAYVDLIPFFEPRDGDLEEPRP